MGSVVSGAVKRDEGELRLQGGVARRGCKGGLQEWGQAWPLPVAVQIAYAGRMIQARPATSTHDRVHAWALAVAGAALAVMPLAMWLANRSAPLCLGIAALACLARSWSESWPLADRLRALRASRAPVTKPLVLLVVLAALSIIWSHRPLASLFALGEWLVPLVSGVVVALVFPSRAPRWVAPALAGSIVLASALTLAELTFGMEWRQGFGLRAMTFMFNRTLICVMLVAIPLLGWLMRQRRWGLATMVAGAVMAGIMISESGAARFGLGMALLAAMATAIAPRLSVITAGIGIVALIMLAPVQGEIAEQVIPPSAHRQLQDSHSRDRVDIWLSFGEAIRARPWLGSGFGTSPTLHESPVAAEVSPARRTLLAVGHPHSAQVQVWAELGMAGAALLLWAGLMLVATIGQRQRRNMIAPLATFASAIAIAAVGHGAWQGWWIATLASSIIWFRIFDAMPMKKGQSMQGRQAP